MPIIAESPGRAMGPRLPARDRWPVHVPNETCFGNKHTRASHDSFRHVFLVAPCYNMITLDPRIMQPEVKTMAIERLPRHSPEWTVSNPREIHVNNSRFVGMEGVKSGESGQEFLGRRCIVFYCMLLKPGRCAFCRYGNTESSACRTAKNSRSGSSIYPRSFGLAMSGQLAVALASRQVKRDTRTCVDCSEAYLHGLLLRPDVPM